MAQLRCSHLPQQYPASATVPSSVSPLPLPPESAPGVSLEASMRLAGIGVSVIDSFPRELLYLTVGKVALDYAREGKVSMVYIPHKRRMCTVSWQLSSAVYLVYRDANCSVDQAYCRSVA